MFVGRSDLTIEVATAHKVAGMFGRRDPMRRFMDKIIAMIDEIGEAHAISQQFYGNHIQRGGISLDTTYKVLLSTL